MITNIFGSIKNKYVLISFVVIVIIVFTFVLNTKVIEQWSIGGAQKVKFLEHWSGNQSRSQASSQASKR